MTPLKLPEQLKGPWQNALILTYSLDLPFFENALWSQFGARCRNKIVLADSQHFLEACDNYARSSDLVRHLNQRYLAAGIFTPRAAHAKLILLTNPEQGRLLVGSGNLTLQGYASGGELFTRYEYDPDATGATDQLPAFLAVRELIEELRDRDYVQGTARRYIDQLLRKTPWLYKSSTANLRPVRHNLHENFLAQLVQEVNNDPVEELWVLVPFYDPQAKALARLVNTFRPRVARLLVQPGYTSVDPEALAQVIGRVDTDCRVQAFSKGNDNPYVHAKLFLLKLKERALCLQGSPNLSQVAMLRTVPEGNLELANLLIGPRDSFDHIFDALALEPAALQLDGLDLAYRSEEHQETVSSPDCRLTGGEWIEESLALFYQGEIPAVEEMWLVIDDEAFAPETITTPHPGHVTLSLTPDAIELLQRPSPVWIRWVDEAGQTQTTNPVFVCNRAALDAEVEATDSTEVLEGISTLDLEDEALEMLLSELDAALVIDRRSVWQMAGRTLHTSATVEDDDDDALRLDYADIDYEMLRRHPKMRQYVMRSAGSSGRARTRLQIILGSIADNFQGLLDLVDEAPRLSQPMSPVDGSDAQSAEEREREEEERQKRRQSQAQRLRRIFKNFIRRYLRGVRSADFQAFAGHEVIVNNYIIFAHLLWCLLQKEWFEPEREFLIDSLLQTWQFFWGNAAQDGYLTTLEPKEQREAFRWLQEHHAGARLLASLYYGSRLTTTTDHIEIRFALRDFWRRFLCDPPFAVTEEILEDTWLIVADLEYFEPPRPTAIADELTRLAGFETETRFLRALEARYGFRSGSCSFDRVRVRRPGIHSNDPVKCLVIRDDKALVDVAAATDVLRSWMQFEALDYFRLHYPRTDEVLRRLFYEVADEAGIYWDEERSVLVDLEGITAPDPAWAEVLRRVQRLAAALDTSLTIPQRRQQPTYVTADEK